MNHRSYLAALAIFVAASHFASAQDTKPLFEKSGELTDQDPKDKVVKSGYAKVHEFKMEAGKAYRIDLASKDFMPVLRLETPEGNPLLVEAGRGGANARMVFKATAAGDYRIIVTSPNETGKYQLSVVEPTKADLLMVRVRELPKANAEERAKTLEDLVTHLQSKGAALAIPDGQLAFTAGNALERSDIRDAGDWCVKIGKALSIADNERIKGLGKSLTGISKRLPGGVLDIEGTLLDGKKIDWKSYRGKVVLVDFWATWCGPCIAELPNMKKMYTAYHDKGFDIVGISLDKNAEKPAEFMKKRELPWACIFDETQPLADAYGITGIPVAILVDKQGKVISSNARGKELDRLLEQQFGPIPEPKVEEKKKSEEK